MAKIPLTITKRDFKRARPGRTHACLLERALERQYGGKWTVGFEGATQRGKSWPRRWRLSDDAAETMVLFDTRHSMREVLGKKLSRTVFLEGKPLEGKPPARRSSSPRCGTGGLPVSRARKRASVAVTFAIFCIAVGLWWVPVLLAAAAAGAVFALRRLTTRRASASRPAVPSFSDLRDMPAAERQALLGGPQMARAADSGSAPEPESAEWDMPPAPWPAPRSPQSRPATGPYVPAVPEESLAHRGHVEPLPSFAPAPAAEPELLLVDD